METRFKHRIKVTLRIVSEIDKHFREKIVLAKGSRFETTICDITATGAGMIVKHYLPKGLVIDLEIRGALFGLRKVMKVKGEVCYCKQVKFRTYRCGVEFLDMPQEYKEAIAKFVNKRPSKGKKKEGLWKRN